MHSVHVDTGRTWRGGQGQVLHLVTGLAARGDTVTLAAPPSSPLIERAAAAGIETIALPFAGEWDVASLLRLRGELVRLSPDVVHTHDAHAVTLGGIAGRMAGVPLIVASRRVDFPVSRLGRVKLNRLVDVVVPVSRAIEAILHRNGVAADRTTVIHSGVESPANDVPVAPLRDQIGVTDAPIIGAVGALVDHKDHATFIDAAQILHRCRPEVRFCIAGQGPLESALRLRITAAGLDGIVTLLGFRDDVPGVLRALDIFVLSSHSEGLGTIVLDAAAAGVAIVATRTGGVPEMITDGVNGRLVPPRDPPAMATAMQALLDEPARRSALVEQARKLPERFSADRMVDATRKLYWDRLAGKPR